MSINPEKHLFCVAVRMWNRAKSRGLLNLSERFDLANAVHVSYRAALSSECVQLRDAVNDFAFGLPINQPIDPEKTMALARAIDAYAQAKSKPKIYDWQTRADCGDPDLNSVSPAPPTVDRSDARLPPRAGSGAARNAAACNPEKQFKAVDLGEQTRRRNPDPVLDRRTGREVAP